MAIIDRIQDLQEEMTAWRRDIHAHPETAFEENRTADLVEAQLKSFGIETHRGLARTGVVGTLTNGEGGAIGLRADMDALPMPEEADVPYKSTVPGKMHACGHDGHTAMLLGAAQYLAETRNFKGTVRFIFQPAEEMAGGGEVMVREGLFEQFPVDAVYGLHNWPNMPAGRMSIRPGPGMAAAALFKLTVKGKGSHAAAPHQGIDPVVVGAEIVTALQTISSRLTNPTEPVVVSVTQFHAGDADNVIANEARLSGTVRSFAPSPEQTIAPAMERIAGGVARAHGADIEFTYDQLYPVLVNEEAESAVARAVAAEVVGDDGVDDEYPLTMASEDFAFMLNARPGCFIRLGSGFAGRDSHPLHSTRYVFNDDVLPIGASYWARLVETVLA